MLLRLLLGMCAEKCDTTEHDCIEHHLYEGYSAKYKEDNIPQVGFQKQQSTVHKSTLVWWLEASGCENTQIVQQPGWKALHSCG